MSIDKSTITGAALVAQIRWWDDWMNDLIDDVQTWYETLDKVKQTYCTERAYEIFSAYQQQILHEGKPGPGPTDELSKEKAPMSEYKGHQNEQMTQSIYVLLQQWSQFVPEDGNRSFEAFMDFLLEQNEKGEL